MNTRTPVHDSHAAGEAIGEMVPVFDAPGEGWDFHIVNLPESSFVINMTAHD